MFTQLERTAAACFVAVVGGIILYKASRVGLDRSTLCWLVISPLCGLILADCPSDTSRIVAKKSLVPAALIWISYAGISFVWLLVSQLNHDDLLLEAISATSMRWAQPMWVLLCALGVLAFAATFGVIVLSALASRPIVEGTAALFRVGPEGFDRIGKSILGLASIVAAVLSLWAAFGHA